ncbi:hypothetical protein AAIB33_14670 [Microbacterium sp. AZCO]|uniref:hypothetical protein n=1 Tax=Microbacterium sp. AZCO TaxID=3142976 RepID=UPI0031F3D90D
MVRYDHGIAGSRIPFEEYADLREGSLHNTSSDTLVLGRWANDDTSYIAVARREDAMYFDMGDDWGNAQDAYDLSPRDDMFEFFIRPALDEAISSGKDIRITHDPGKAGGSFLERRWTTSELTAT